MLKKIFFYSPNDSMYSYRKYLTAVPLFLDSYVKEYHKDIYQQIEWTKITTVQLDKDKLFKTIEDLEIDILALGIYLWNEKILFDLIKDIKSKIKREIKIIIGGPSVTPNIGENIMKENHDIDFAIYSQGEKAFASVLEHLINSKKIDAINDTNLIWRKNDKVRKNSFEFLRLSNRSPYYESKDILEKYAKEIKNEPAYQNVKIVMPYMTSRGCMYKCSFCSYQEGYTHKVYHRKFNIRDELETLAKSGILNIDFTDANFGQHSQDYDIAKAIVDLKKEKGYNFKVSDCTFSKLKLEENIKIMDLWGRNKIINTSSIGVQDTDPKVLENIDRPTRPWPEVKSALQKLKKEIPSIDFNIELIQGLPGQTRDTWEKTLIDTMSDGFTLGIYPWMQLPASPSIEKSYIEKMKLGINSMSYDVDGRRYNIITETYSYDQKDYAYFSLISFLVGIPEIGKIKNRSQLFGMVKSFDNLEYTLNKMTNYMFDNNWVNKRNEIMSEFILKFFKKYNKNLKGIDLKSIIKHIQLNRSHP